MLLETLTTAKSANGTGTGVEVDVLFDKFGSV